jgi:hypothetical protein
MSFLTAPQKIEVIRVLVSEFHSRQAHVLLEHSITLLKTGNA